MYKVDEQQERNDRFLQFMWFMLLSICTCGFYIFYFHITRQMQMVALLTELRDENEQTDKTNGLLTEIRDQLRNKK